MKVNLRNAEDVICPEHLEHYEELHQDIWFRLVRLNHTITTLEKLVEFPLQHVCKGLVMTFWDTLFWNFQHMAIILLHGLIDDQGEGAHTLPKFRNKLLTEGWIRSAERDAYRKVLRESKFDAQMGPIREHVKKLRNTIIAHRAIDHRTGLPLRLDRGVLAAELRELFDETERLFKACCFGGTFWTTTWGYADCVQKVLDSVAKTSIFVNQPERRGASWPQVRERMSPEALRVMNDFRRRFGLPGA